eukprot:c35231_g1_i1 orf=3-197(-)
MFLSYLLQQANSSLSLALPFCVAAGLADLYSSLSAHQRVTFKDRPFNIARRPVCTHPPPHTHTQT